MNPFLLYVLLLKATLTSFSGLASLPMVRSDLVVQRKVLTDRELNAAVVAGRTSPGPNGLYLVSVGYYADGLPGATAGFLAVMTPAFLVLPLMRWAGARAGTPRVKSAIRAVLLASAGLLLSAGDAAGTRRDHRIFDPRHHAAEFCGFSADKDRYGLGGGGRRGAWMGRKYGMGRKNDQLSALKGSPTRTYGRLRTFKRTFQTSFSTISSLRDPSISCTRFGSSAARCRYASRTLR